MGILHQFIEDYMQKKMPKGSTLSETITQYHQFINDITQGKKIENLSSDTQDIIERLIERFDNRIPLAIYEYVELLNNNKKTEHQKKRLEQAERLLPFYACRLPELWKYAQVGEFFINPNAEGHNEDSKKIASQTKLKIFELCKKYCGIDLGEWEPTKNGGKRILLASVILEKGDEKDKVEKFERGDDKAQVERKELAQQQQQEQQQQQNQTEELKQEQELEQVLGKEENLKQKSLPSEPDNSHETNQQQRQQAQQQLQQTQQELQPLQPSNYTEANANQLNASGPLLFSGNSIGNNSSTSVSSTPSVSSPSASNNAISSNTAPDNVVPANPTLANTALTNPVTQEDLENLEPDEVVSLETSDENPDNEISNSLNLTINIV